MLRFQGHPTRLPFLISLAPPSTKCLAQEFRVRLLCRILCRLPPSPHYCQCGCPLDAVGHHRAACRGLGCWSARGDALESAAARVCREAGARMSLNTALLCQSTTTVICVGRRKIQTQKKQQICRLTDVRFLSVTLSKFTCGVVSNRTALRCLQS